MQIGVLTSPDSWYLRDLQRAAVAGEQLTALPFSQLAAGVGGQGHSAWWQTDARVEVDEFDAVLVRAMPPGSLEQVVFRMNVLQRIAAGGVLVTNPPRSLEIAIDKYLAAALLQAAGLAVPRTVVAQTLDDSMRAFFELGEDVVVKPLFGSEGRGITRITDEAVAWRTFKTLVELRSVVYLQEFIAHHGYDLRLFVLGDEVLGMRRANPSDWRTNISRGARAEALELTAGLRQTAQRAADAVQTPLAAVDVLPAVDGREFVLEVNAVPGWRTLSRTLNVDVSRMVLDWIRRRLNGG